MTSVSVTNLRNQAVVADKCAVAESFCTRLIGLMGKRVLMNSEGMFFPRCNSIHMWFMRLPLDIIFLKIKNERNYEVISVKEAVKPWRLLPLFETKAADTLELPVGTVKRCEILSGDTLCIS